MTWQMQIEQFWLDSIYACDVLLLNLKWKKKIKKSQLHLYTTVYSAVSSAAAAVSPIPVMDF